MRCPRWSTSAPTLLALAFILVTCPFVDCIASLSERALPPPSQDPFYQPPAGFENTQPGAVLRQRPIAAGFFQLIPNPVEAHQLLYRTTAVNGSAIATVTTIFKPLLAKQDRFISLHTAYDTACTVCNPSYLYRLGSDPQNDTTTSIELLLAQAYVASGYIVASPDYEGPDAAFNAGRLEGMGVLDGMRAVINFRNTLKLSDAPLIVGTGYSGGATATGWAASLQQSYAPELTIKGWVMGGTPANLTGNLLYIDKTAYSGYIPATFDGFLKPSAYRAQLEPFFRNILTPYGQQVLDYTNSHCSSEFKANFANKSVLTTDFQSLGPGLLSGTPLRASLDQNLMGARRNETPTSPVLLYHAEHDEIVPYANASTLADNWCSQDASVQFTTYSVGGHVTTEVAGLPAAYSFITAAFSGAVKVGCSKTTNAAINPITSLGNIPLTILLKLNNLAKMAI
ncbi:hypothetical protein HIM_10747 [Hirsutella minnesotensis 3608]|uniref:Uncharacterized protein n=1 Tax=Hirsutella minnesotensis 3608 TaxID=1043627 RepID=A0A0F7ZWZ8_9HYPO|nr:hypothetical protein HIM_10747 [Hirsutella minnesotensis 3608]